MINRSLLLLLGAVGRTDRAWCKRWLHLPPLLLLLLLGRALKPRATPAAAAATTQADGLAKQLPWGLVKALHDVVTTY